MAKSLKLPNNLLILSGLVLILGCVILSCKKANSSNPVSRSFIKSFQTDSAAVGTHVEQLPDGGFMIVASDGAGRPVLIRTDKYGNERWTKTIPYYCFTLSSNLAPHWWSTQLGPNLFTLQAGIKTTNIDTMGNIISAYTIPNSSYNDWYNGPVLKSATGYLLPMCNGGNTGAPSDNYVFVMDKNLVYQRTDVFEDKVLGGKTLQFFVYGATSSGAYYIWGQKFPRNPGFWTWSDNAKIFVARVQGKAPATETIIEGTNQQYYDSPEFQVPGPDSSIILLAQRTDYKTNSIYPLVLKFDKNQTLVWEKVFPSTLGSVNLFNMSSCSDGGFIMTGSFRGFGFTDLYPCALKIDQSGNEQWGKTMFSVGNGELLYSITTSDGGYGFVGYTNAFGKGKNGNRILFIKTDANGNL